MNDHTFYLHALPLALLNFVWKKRKIYSLRLWLSFFCLSFARARVSVSDQKEDS